MVREIIIETPGAGLHDITTDVTRVVSDAGVDTGLCTLFIRHTSASLVIQEAADPSARRDLERWFDHLVAPNDPLYTHTAEGPDDMPSHIKSALTATSLSIPIIDGALALGTWQGVYLWEHRAMPHHRRLLVHISE